MWTYNNELYHFGIKGMKWGVRRFQNKDGTLTSKGKKRYDDDGNSREINKSKKSNHRTNLENKYREKGMSEKQAIEAANKRIKTEKIIAGVAGLTLAAAGSYLITKEVMRRTDGILKSGTTMQTIIGNDPNRDFNNPFYTSYKKSDKDRYEGLYGKTLSYQGKVHKVTLEANKDIKIASKKKAEDAFMELYKTDPEFRYNFKKSMRNLGPEVNGLDKRNSLIKSAKKTTLTDRELRKAYDAFNVGLVDHSISGNSNSKKFYDKLKSKGYDAIVDVNDKKYSGYNSKKPVIVFNKGDKINVKNKEELYREVIDKKYSQEYKKLAKRENVKESAKGLMPVGIYGAGMYGGVKVLNKISINNYRKQHPNSKLTDKQIMELLRKEQNQVRR